MVDIETITAMHDALEDEYKARATYRKVIERFGRVRPFVNIIQAEERHIEALLARPMQVAALKAPSRHQRFQALQRRGPSRASACSAARSNEQSIFKIQNSSSTMR